MWGNSLGWSISVLIVALAAGWMYLISTGTNATPPTSFSRDPQHFAALTIPEPSPAAKLPPQTEDRDAGDLYRQAIEHVEADRITYEDFAARGALASPAAAKLDAIDLLVQATPCAKMNLFASHPQQIVNYEHEKKPLEALRLLGKVGIDRLGLLKLRGGDADGATKLFQAGFALGEKLARERLTVEELRIGLELMSKSAAAMASAAEHAGDNDRAAALNEFTSRLATFTREQVDPVARVTHAIDPRIVGEQTGDVFELARRSQERMWRVEAILQLGRVRYFAGEGGTSGNQRAATALVTKLAAEDPDPIIRAAATAARDLTAEQHRMQ